MIDSQSQTVLIRPVNAESSYITKGSSDSGFSFQPSWSSNRISATKTINFNPEIAKIINSVFTNLSLVTNEDLEPETANYQFFDSINQIRHTNNYRIFLDEALKKPEMIQEAILSFLAHCNYQSVTEYEENFLMKMISRNNLRLQNYALETLYNWGNYRDKESLRKIKINNSYLDQELTNFLNRF